MGNIAYNRGTTFTIAVNYTPLNGVAGSSVLFTVKSAVDDDTTDAAAIFKTSAGMSGNTATLTITPTSIADTNDQGDYTYDVKVVDSGGNIYLIDSGTFTINVSATNRLT